MLLTFVDILEIYSLVAFSVLPPDDASVRLHSSKCPEH